MSGEKVPYHLRQNKHVERELFLDILAHVDRVHPIKSYLYVGFGGAYLEDFSVLHSHFGNTAMLSLERESWVYDRQLLNVPYGCVKCRNTTSLQFIQEFEDIAANFRIAKNVLIWFDYASAKQLRQQITEVHALTAKLKALDILKITLNANPSVLGGDPRLEREDALRLARLETLRARLGDVTFLKEWRPITSRRLSILASWSELLTSRASAGFARRSCYYSLWEFSLITIRTTKC